MPVISCNLSLFASFPLFSHLFASEGSFRTLYPPVVGQEVSKLDSSAVVHELELVINRDLYGCLCGLGSQ